MSRQFGQKPVLDENQIAVGLGSTQLAMDLLEVILNPGDKILLLDPSYCNYPTQVITGIIDANILRFPVLDNSTWEYLPDTKINEFHDFILENKPKIILLISPDGVEIKELRIVGDVSADAFLKLLRSVQSDV